MMPEKKTRISIANIRKLALDACLACGASAATANSFIDATVSAACFGRKELGFPDFIGCVKSLRAGRIEGQAKLRIDYVLPALIHSDAGGGIAQLGFDLIYEDFKERTRTFGVAVFTQKKPGSFASFD